MVSPAPPTKTDSTKKEEARNKKAEEDKAKEDALFEALLNSQRNILAKLDFGSSSDLQFVEGPDNLPLVSPNASAEFQLSYSNGGEYDPEYEEYLHQQQQYHQQQQFHDAQQQQQQYPRHSHDEGFTFGVGDDRFILEHIDIAPGDVRGPEVFEVDNSMRRRKRETEQEEEMTLSTSQRSKKARNGSFTLPTESDDLLPGPSDLDDLDASSASLLLDDLDFPSITDDAMWKPRERTVTEDSDVMEAEPKDTTEDLAMDSEHSTKAVKTCVSMEEDNSHSTRSRSTRPPLPKRSSRSLWRPRRRSSVDVSIEERRSMWKPRKRDSLTTPSHDSSISLQMEDLEFPERSIPKRTVSSHSQRMQVSLGDMTEEVAPAKKRSPPSRTTSGDSTGSNSVQTLSEAFQQSIGSTKTIQEWDKKMGLKKSHSDTMRKSSKSREQLLALFSSKQEQDELHAMEEESNVVPHTVSIPVIQEEEAVVVEL